MPRKNHVLKFAGVALAFALILTMPQLSDAAPQDDSSEVLAEVGDQKVTVADLEEMLASQLAQLEQQRQEMFEAALPQLIDNKLIEIEAAAQGMEPGEFFATKSADVQEVTDADIDAWYEANKARVQQPKENVAEQIRAFLVQERTQAVRQEVVAELRAKHSVKMLFEPVRKEVDSAEAPYKGGADAPVTIVEFSDFQCPFCSRINPELAKVREKYGDKVKVVFRQFPLHSIHPEAQKAAEASLCAGDQGKFWELHDKMFANQRALKVDNLKTAAEEIGLDMEVFSSCLDSGAKASQVTADLRAGQAAGVSGTPSVFVNGRAVRMVRGTPHSVSIGNLVDDELSRMGGS